MNPAIDHTLKFNQVTEILGETQIWKDLSKYDVLEYEID